MTATANSRRVRTVITRPVKIATGHILSTRNRVADDSNWIKRWPAAKFAVSRTPSANGRTNRLIVSIIIKTGIRGAGVPSGKRCPKAIVG